MLNTSILESSMVYIVKYINWNIFSPDTEDNYRSLLALRDSIIEFFFNYIVHVVS